MDITIEELKKLSREYFKNLTPEKYKRDSKKAKVGFYNKIDVSLFGDNIMVINYFFNKESSFFEIPLETTESYYSVRNYFVAIGQHSITYADDFIYSIAA